LGADGKVLGVIVFRINGAAIAAILDEVTKNTDRRPFLVDADGILIYYPERRFLYQSLVQLDEEKRQRIIKDQRFGKDNPIKNLNMPILAQAMLGSGMAGNISYTSTLSGVEEVAGYAPLTAHQWVVGITESRAVFEAPLNRLFSRVLTSALLIGLVFFFLALLFSRSIVRPIQQLTQAAHALKRGDYALANIKSGSDDEIGRLVRTFNVMVDVLRQRDRERLRNTKQKS
jgi:methyl-accepting chemotaxis protein